MGKGVQSPTEAAFLLLLGRQGGLGCDVAALRGRVPTGWGAVLALPSLPAPCRLAGWSQHARFPLRPWTPPQIVVFEPNNQVLMGGDSASQGAILEEHHSTGPEDTAAAAAAATAAASQARH